MSKKIVVLGNGMLGKEISKQTGWDNISREENGFDITDTKTFNKLLSVEFGAIQYSSYDTIINCVANTNTYLDERDPHWEVNYRGIDNLVEFCNKWKIKLIHVSTDYVYVNAGANQSEKDVPVHQGTWYAYTKLLGDSHVQLKSKDYLIVRGGHKPNPFPYDNAYDDIVGNFDYVDKNASIIIKLVKNNSSGVFNIGTEPKSMYDLAKQTNKNVGKDICGLACSLPKTLLMDISKLKKELHGDSND